MSFVTNIAALRAERQLTRATKSLQESFERLSSGLRITKASDDAAGLAIAERLRVESRLQSQALRNINDGIRLADVAVGALEGQRNILFRLSELAEQSANGTLSATQRKSLNAEYQSLLREFGRIGDSTTFNGLDLLLGERGAGSLALQAGISGDALSQLFLETRDTGTLSGILDMREGNDTDISPSWGSTDDYSAFYAGLLYSATVIDENGEARDVLIGVRNYSAYSGVVRVEVMQRVEDTGAIGSSTFAGFYVAANNIDEEWIISSYQEISIDDSTGEIALDTLTFDFLFDDNTVGGLYELDTAGLRVANSNNSAPGGTTAIDFTGVETVSRAQVALETAKRKLGELSGVIGDFGAVQSRLETAASVAATSRENTASAESRIRDVDVAEQAAKLTAQTILQRMGAAVLAQANQQGELLLRLIRPG